MEPSIPHSSSGQPLMFFFFFPPDPVLQYNFLTEPFLESLDEILSLWEGSPSWVSCAPVCLTEWIKTAG